MNAETPEIRAARSLAADAAARLHQVPAFQRLDAATRSAILRDLGTIRSALHPATTAATPSTAPARKDPYAFALETPNDLRRRLFAPRTEPAQPIEVPASGGQTPGPRQSATETLAARTGALIDEVDFPRFVAGLIYSTFDAMVDASIRQMEAFGDLVSAVAKNAEDFTRENDTANQARDWLVEHYPRDLALDTVSLDTGQPRLRARRRPDNGEETDVPPPEWLAEFNLSGEELTDELVEQQLVPAVRRRIGEGRLQTLATMVLLGMNRIVVRDGSISARVRFRAAASDKAKVDYAASQDPGGSAWGQRGSSVYTTHTTMISTVGVNAQTDQSLRAELFGEVKINFVSETLPLERFADEARVALLQRHARPALGQPAPGVAPAPAPAAPPAPASAPAPGPAPTPAPAAPPAPPPATPAPVAPPAIPGGGA